MTIGDLIAKLKDFLDTPGAGMWFRVGGNLYRITSVRFPADSSRVILESNPGAIGLTLNDVISALAGAPHMPASVMFETTTDELSRHSVDCVEVVLYAKYVTPGFKAGDIVLSSAPIALEVAATDWYANAE